MVRIDGARGRIAGIRPGGRTPLVDSGARQLAEGFASVANAVKQRELEAADAEATRQVDADKLTLAEQSAAFRERLTAVFDEESDGFDGSQPGFSNRTGERFDAELDESLGAIDPRLQTDAALRFGNVRDNFRLAAINLEDTRRTQHVLSGIVATVDSEALGVQRDASALELARDNVELAIDAAPAALRGKLREESLERLGNAFLTNLINNDPAAGLSAIKGGELDGFLDAEKQAQWRGILGGEIERRKNQAEREADKRQRVAVSNVNEELRDIKTLRGLGLAVSGERYDQLERVAAVAGGGALDDVILMRDANRTSETVKKLPLADATQQVAALRDELAGQGDVGRGDALRLEAAEDALDGMRLRIDDDFLSFAGENRGGIEALDFDNPVASLKARAASAREAADYYGVAPRFFTNAELDSLQGRLDQNKQARLAFIEAAAAAGAPEMLAEIAPKAPEITHLARVVALGGERSFVNEVLQGRDLKNGGDFPTTVSRSAVDAPAIEQRVIGSALSQTPDFARDIVTAAGLAYDARSRRASRARDDFDSVDYVNALQAAAGARGNGARMTGGIGKFGDRTVLVPQGAPNRNFKTFWRGLSDAQWAAANDSDARDADGRVIALKELRRGVPVAVNAGVYQIDMGRNEQNPQWAMGADGRPWRFDFNAVRNFTINKNDKGE